MFRLNEKLHKECLFLRKECPNILLCRYSYCP
nr:MAG TPA: hypothetical protein [Caudoviricetes sp.]